MILSVKFQIKLRMCIQVYKYILNTYQTLSTFVTLEI